MNENANKIICAHCGEAFDRSDLTETANGLVCQDCLDDHYTPCDRCGEYIPIEDATEVRTGGFRPSTEYWCPDCVYNYATRCQHCGDYVVNSRIEEDDFGNRVCDGCYSDYYRRCSECGCLTREDNTYWDEDTDTPYCCDCYSSRPAKAINQYGYKPDPIFGLRRGEGLDTDLTFGVELEVDGGSDAEDTARAVVDASDGRVYCKHDGSLGDDGFEIVSHPGTLAHHTYETRWRAITAAAKKAGYKSHDTETCGLHIHVGRRGLGETALERVQTAHKLVLLAWHLKDALTTFSRRTEYRLNRWAKFPSLDVNPCMSDDLLLSYATDTEDDGRYQAVNLENSATVEFRIFRGTLERDTLIASLQLVHNLCRYAMTHTPSECITCTYRDIVSAQPFGELVAYSQKRDLLHEEAETA